MAKSGVGCRFRDLEYFEVGFIYLFTYILFSLIFLEFIINWRATLQKFVEKISV